MTNTRMASYEQRYYPILPLKCLLFSALFLHLITTAESKFKVVGAENPAIWASTAPARPRCGCKGAEGPWVCANNGLQYKNMCVFQCAQRQNPRLSVIRTGNCEGLTRETYFTAKPRS